MMRFGFRFHDEKASGQKRQIASLSRRITISVLTLLLIHVPGSASAEKITIRLATGSKTGVYYPIGHGIKKVIEKSYPDTILVEVVETKGTTDNLHLLDNELVELALVQNDTAYHFSHGEAMFNMPSGKALAVASLYTEYIQIIATNNSEIRRLDQLKGRRIRTGSPPETTPNSATIIFSLDGWEASDLVDVRCKFSEARELLVSNALDAAFVTAGIPTPLLTKKIEGSVLQDHVRLIPIGEGLANRLIRASPYFVYTEIPAHTYINQEQPVRTLGVRAILVARRGFEEKTYQGQKIPPNFIKTITRLIFEEADTIRTEHGISGVDLTKYQFPIEEGLDGILDHRRRPIIPVHPQAWAYYEEEGVLQKTLKDYLSTILSSGIVTLLLIFFFKFRVLVRRFFERHIHLRLGVIFICLYVLGTLVMFFCERFYNTSFETLSESFWSITIYMLSGFEDRYPVTWAGRIISILIFVLSVFFFGAIAGRFAAAFLKRQEMKMPSDIKDHIVICNWNDRGRMVVKELRHPEGKPNAEIVIVDDNVLDEKELLSLPLFKKIHFINKDPIRHGTLRDARVKYADTIIILADRLSPDPDAKSAMIVLALLRECKRDKPHIISEVANLDNSQHLIDAGADETICTTEIGVGILAHCAVNKQLSKVYKDLLNYTLEGNELYIIQREAYPDEFVGKQFVECAQLICQNRDHKNPVILLGIRRQDKIIMNPKGSADDFESQIREGDGLIAMAFSPPNLRVEEVDLVDMENAG